MSERKAKGRDESGENSRELTEEQLHEVSGGGPGADDSIWLDLGLPVKREDETSRRGDEGATSDDKQKIPGDGEAR